MKETELYAPVVAGMLSEGHAVFKIADGSVGKKPFDIAGTTLNGLAIGLELKIWKTKNATETEAESIPWQLFETHQIAWLKAYAAKGAIALGGVYYPSDGLLRVWRLASPSDSCDRLADFALAKSAGIFKGWKHMCR